MTDVRWGEAEIELVCGSDTVEHPAHYCSGGVECIDAIKSSMTLEAYCGYCKGNVMKYIFRYEKKGGIEDLQKASVYLTWLIAAEREREDGAAT